MQATENNLNTKWLLPSAYFVNPSAVFSIQGYMGQKYQDGYYAAKCHIFINFEA